jgi:hypothetical protein
MPALPLALGVALLGALLVVIGLAALRGSGARFALGRRLAGAHGMSVGDVLALDELPPRPVRIAGRIRCSEPILTPRDDRLVALHRDVEVELPGSGWRTIERLRETRAFELWDHDGSLTIDPGQAAEPLVTIPHVWRGRPDELDGPLLASVERLAAEGTPAVAARAETRMISVVDRLLVLARVERDAGGAVRLAPPRGGYLIATLELDESLRLLGGRRRGLLAVAAAAVAGGLLLVMLGIIVAIAGALTA